MERMELGALYNISETPRRITRDSSLAINFIDEYLNDKENAEYCLDDIIFFANLMGVAPDLGGLGAIKEQLPAMIDKCCRAALVPASTIAELISSVTLMRTAMAAYELQRRENIKSPFEKDHGKEEILFYDLPIGYKRDTPIFSVHICGAAKGEALRPNYRKFTLEINIFLRNIESGSSRRLFEVAQMMRYFIENAPEANSALLEEAVMSAIPSIAKNRKWISDTSKQFKQFVETIFSEPVPAKGRDGGYHRIASDIYLHTDVLYLADRPEELGDKGRKSAAKVFTMHAAPREALREGETVGDYLVEEIIMPSPSPFQDCIVNSYIPQSVLHYQRYPFHWDRRTLKLHDLSLIYYFLFDEYAQAGYNIVTTKLLIECGLLLGLEIDAVMNVSIGESADVHDAGQQRKATTDVHLQYHPDRQSISYHIPPTALGYQKVVVSENCLSSGALVELRLPKEIAESFTGVVDEFSTDRMGSESHFLFPSSVKAKTYTQLKHFLRSFESRFEIKITHQSLARSFKLYFQYRYGCDPLCISYVAADLGPETRTQRFYSRIMPERLHAEYYRGYKPLKAAIGANIIEISKDDETVVPRKSLLYLEGGVDQPGADDLKELYPFGSKVVPEIEPLTEFYKRLTTLLESMQVMKLSNLCNFHNLYTLYAFITLQFGSGLRPVRDLLTKIVLNDRGKIFIGDKNSGKRQENRIIHIPPLVSSILKQLESGAKATLPRISVSNSRNLKKSGQIFYFIEDKYRVVNVAPKTIRRRLETSGLSEMYDYPLNCARHLMRTILAERNVSSELIDAWMGHQLYGREYMNTYSTCSIEALSIVSHIIGGILDELGIRFIKYKTL